MMTTSQVMGQQGAELWHCLLIPKKSGGLFELQVKFTFW
jgi:hypothetical protein